MPMKASVSALIGIGTKAILQEEGGGGTWVCGIVLVSLSNKDVPTVGSDFVPQEKPRLHDLPTSPHPARVAARVVYGKVWDGSVIAWT